MVVFGALLPGLLLGILAMLTPDGAVFFATLLSVPMLLIFAPTLFASFYISYRDVFIAVDDDA